jgi:hypothetical protein
LSRSRQLEEFGNKYLSPGADTSDLESLTYAKFLKVNRYMKRFSRREYPVRSYIQSTDPFLDKVLIRARALVHRVLGGLERDEWFDACKHGTGSSIGVPYVDTGIEGKFTFPLTTTSSVVPLFFSYLSSERLTLDAIVDFNGYDPTGSRFELVSGSRATTVDKTTSIRRMIAIEPTLNMFFQQGLMHVMYDRMKSHGLDVDTLPERHVEKAREASIDRNHATIDFSSASDCVSTGLVQYLFPEVWFKHLTSVRSPLMTIQGCDVDLQMFSTMGNATTFPIETLVFWSLGNAVTFTLENEGTNTSFLPFFKGGCRSMYREGWVNYPCSVFGDDCIVPTKVAPAFMQVCEGFGFIPNQEKSHYLASDPFRESCGGDFHSGFPTRPIKPRAPSSSKMSAMEPWLYMLSNALIKKYIEYFGCNLYVYHLGFMRYIEELFRENNLRIKIVPPDFPDDAGLQDNGDLHRIVRDRTVIQTVLTDPNDTPKVYYCRFVFRSPNTPTSPGLRYWSRLREFNLASLKPDAWHDFIPPEPQINALPEGEGLLLQFDSYRKRRNGGYVVGKATAPHWDVPVWMVDHHSCPKFPEHLVA